MDAPQRRWNFRELTMGLDYLVGGVLAVALTAYLVYALVYPERF